ncbi:MAG: FixH family protein [Gammaproteobacteria bacterium]|nr:FixH family protein [Gammaproteobacteria bacterium]
MNEATLPVAKRPWYREPMVWLVIALPLSVVIAGISTVVIASRNADSLVVDGFQRVGLLSSRVSAADREASRLGLQAMVRIDAENELVMVSLSGNDASWQAGEVQASLHHPTRREQDFTLLLQSENGSLFTAGLPREISAGWYLQIESRDGSWRLSGQFADAGILRLAGKDQATR